MNILELNDYILLLIFKNLPINDLGNLCKTCVLFETIVNNLVLFKASQDLLITGHGNVDGSFNQKSVKKISNYNRIKISENWRTGRYEEHTLFYHRIMYPSQLHLDRRFLYITDRGCLRMHRRLNRGKRNLLDTTIYKSYGNTRDADITCMVSKDEIIFGGRDDGRIFINDREGNFTEQKTTAQLGSKDAHINSVDFHKDFCVTASMMKIQHWRQAYELGMLTLDNMGVNEGLFKCVKISPNGNVYAAGKFHDTNLSGLRLFDIQTNSERILNSKSGAVYNLCWRDSQTLLTANFDTTLRLVDCRIEPNSNDEQIWMDPYDSSIYTLDYDGLYGVVCGMKYHCRVNLYDLRVPKRTIQMFYPKIDHWKGSPVYSMACDLSQLFIATDHNLRIFNFDPKHNVESKDFSEHFSKIKIC